VIISINQVIWRIFFVLFDQSPYTISNGHPLRGRCDRFFFSRSKFVPSCEPRARAKNAFTKKRAPCLFLNGFISEWHRWKAEKPLFQGICWCFQFTRCQTRWVGVEIFIPSILSLNSRVTFVPPYLPVLEHLL